MRCLKSQLRKRQAENALTKIQETETTNAYKIGLKQTLK